MRKTVMWKLRIIGGHFTTILQTYYLNTFYNRSGMRVFGIFNTIYFLQNNS